MKIKNLNWSLSKSAPVYGGFIYKVFTVTGRFCSTTVTGPRKRFSIFIPVLKFNNWGINYIPLPVWVASCRLGQWLGLVNHCNRFCDKMLLYDKTIVVKEHFRQIGPSIATNSEKVQQLIMYLTTKLLF